MKKLSTLVLALVASVGSLFAWNHSHVQIGDLYYNLDGTSQTAEVTWQYQWSVDNYLQLTEVTIPASVTYNAVVYNVTGIGDYTFSTCESLTSISIPNSVTSIGERAFSHCTRLPSLTINDGVTSIGIAAFSDCSGLTSIEIPNSVINLSQQVFERCKNLESITMGNGVEYIGQWAFDECYKLKDIFVPCGELERFKQICNNDSRLKYIPSQYIVTAQESEYGYVEIPSFSSCDERINVCAIPYRGYQFNRWSDGNSDNPRTIELTQDTMMEAIFNYLLTGKCGKDSALTWTLDKTTMALNITGEGALSENYTYGTFIESLTIGNEVTSIGQSAFSGCNNLKNVIIGSSVKVLEYGAFAGCSSVETITCYSQRPPTVNGALYGLDYSTIVYVPAEYLETYKMHDAWGLYDVRPLESPEAIENVEKEKNASGVYKLLRNGKILILRGNRTYTLTGAEVK